MKKKLLSLLALLLCVCSGAWAATETFGGGYTKNADAVLTSITIPGGYVEGSSTSINSQTGTKMRFTVTNASVGNASGFGFTVNAGYKVTGLTMYIAGNGSTATLSKIDVDGTTYTGSENMAIASTKGSPAYTTITLSDINATSYINFVQSTTTSQCIVYMSITYEQTATLYTASFDKNGHGTAPSTQSNVLAITLPTIGEDWYQNTGWQADQDVTVGGETVTAGTTIACGATATLTANTTFTAQWTSSDYPYADGVTFPTYPTGTLDMATQTEYTPSDGYVVDRLMNIRNSSKTWYSENGAGSAAGQQWTAPEGSVFTSQTSDVNVMALMLATKTYAVKFTGTTEFQALMNSRASGSYVHAKLVDVTSTKSVVATKNINGISNNAAPTLTSDYIATFSGLTPSHTYVVFFYGYNNSANGLIYEIALKEPDTTAPTLSSSTPADGATDVAQSGTIVLTFDESIGTVDATKFTLTGATKGTVAIDEDDDTKVNVAYSDADYEATVTLSVAAGAVADITGNASAALSDITFTIEEESVGGDLTFNYSTDDTKAYTNWTKSPITVNSSASKIESGGYIQLAANGTVQVVGANALITNVAVTYSRTDDNPTVTASVGTTVTASNSGATWTNSAGVQSLTLTFSAKCRPQIITVTYVDAVAVSTLADRNYGTCVTSQKLDFTNVTDAKAYIATGLNGTGTAVLLTQVYKVPANEPIIIYTTEKDEAATVYVPQTTAAADAAVSENLLIAGDGTTAYNGYTGYDIYYVASDEFHKANDGTLQSGKAYLKVANGGGARLSIVFNDDETTGIEAIEHSALTTGQYFDLQGRRVAQPTKGLYIVNGRKVVIR